jgi:DnaJ-class molecular chaperone
MDAYQILGVTKESSDEEIRTAYKRKAMACHPDRGGNIDEFQTIKKAYEMLQRRVCPVCGGRGEIEVKQGAVKHKELCPKCWRK